MLRAGVSLGRKEEVASCFGAARRHAYGSDRRFDMRWCGMRYGLLIATAVMCQQALARVCRSQGKGSK